MSAMRLFSWRDPPRFKDRSGKPPGLIPLRRGEDLVKEAEPVAHLEALTATAMIPRADFEHSVRPTLVRYAEYVQQIAVDRRPVLNQGLAVAREALALMRTHPAIPKPEPANSALSGPVQAYALLTAALLRQASHLATQTTVLLYDQHGERLGPWCPLHGAMRTQAKAAGYAVASRREESIAGLPLLLSHALLTEAGLAWLFDQPAVAAQWLATLNAPAAEGPLAGLIRAAENRLQPPAANRSSAPVAAVQPPPLREALIEALRVWMGDPETRLNDREAIGWRVGEHLYLIGKHAAQCLRTYPGLQRYGGILQSTETVYRLLREQNITVGEAEKPIVTVQVTGQDWTVTVAVIQIPIQVMWDDSSQMPEPFRGTVKAAPR